MNKVMKLIVAGFLTLAALTALAMDLNAAKSRGFVGEQQNGYLGLVDRSAPSDAKSLMREVNDQRRANYQSIARSNGIDLKSVESLAGQKAINKTARGHYIQAPNGQWVKK
jgi:uncharacterized protein YdbL (DUF1318 family)